jgi:hypothetical protein
LAPGCVVIDSGMLRIPAWPWLAACALLPVLVAAAVHPVLDGGINDDWTYIHMARVFAGTGRVAYDGWILTMSVPAVIYGGILIRLFGFSYLLLRLSILPFWAGSGVLIWLLGRRIGLPPALAALASFSVTMSPVAIPLGTSFMTDMPVMMLMLLTVYCVMRGIDSGRWGVAMAWFCAAAVAGDLAGMIRDIFSAAPALMLAAAACLRWRERKLAGAVAGLAGVTVAIALAGMKWHYAQPHTRQNVFSLAYAHGLGIPLLIVNHAGESVLTLLLLSLPVLVCFLARGRALRGKPLCLAAGGVALIAAVGYWQPRMIQAPWLGNLFTQYGPIRGNEDTWGAKPVLIPESVQILLGLTVYACASAAASLAWQRFRADRRDLRTGLRLAWEQRSPFLVFALTTFPFLALSIGLLAVRSLYYPTFDRYLLPLAVFTALYAAWFLHRLTGNRGNSMAAWTALALLAAFGTASTHDLFATDRARLAAATWVGRQNVARRCITAGYEYDGETQLAEQGVMVEAPSPELKRRPIDFWFFAWTPAVQPCMYVVLSREPKLGAVANQIEYTTWLSPRTRHIFVQHGPEPCPASCNRPSVP